ncbi:MAG: hypothetical protein GY705_12050 [Bacteroidetes bacterium]|nr:hypothetical protein [Bacteroidota bacterium]
MNKLFFLFALLFMLACNSAKKNTIPCYAWLGGPRDATDKEIKDHFKDLKKKGISGLMYNGGQDPEVYRRVGKIAKKVGLEFHTWIPTLIQHNNPKLEKDWYAINGLGESAYDKPAYVAHYQFACPNREEVYGFLEDLYGEVADIPEVDGIHLDFIRFPDVILARGLWDKYGLVMDKEYPEYDYCYCDKCVADFEAQSNIDIKSVEDPSQVEEWKQFRYDLITNLVNRLTEVVHSKNKQMNAAVFPGPNSIAKKIVRQEWDKWNIDAFYPMNYNDFYLEGTEWIGDVCEEAVTTIDNKKPVYSGLFICPKPESKAEELDPENHGLMPEELADAIRESMENGAAGICLFTPGRMTEAHWKVFKKAIREQYVKR